MKPLLMTSPHSGEELPPEAPWLSKLSEPVLMCDVDRFVDALYQPAFVKLNLVNIIARWHRYAADLNRLPNDIDPTCVMGASSDGGQFPEGMGVHWSATTKGDQLMSEPMTRELHDKIIAKYHRPFHEAIELQYKKFFASGFTKIFHIDCHSMPSLGTSKHKDPGKVRPQIVVSDYHGKSSEAHFKDLVIEAYKSAGFEVAYNWPYVGGRLTQTYGHPEKGQNTIQVEMSRALYMDEDSKQLDVQKSKKVREQILAALQRIVESI